jgi:hypothetical protein
MRPHRIEQQPEAGDVRRRLGAAAVGGPIVCKMEQPVGAGNCLGGQRIADAPGEETVGFGEAGGPDATEHRNPQPPSRSLRTRALPMKPFAPVTTA